MALLHHYNVKFMAQHQNHHLLHGTQDDSTPASPLRGISRTLSVFSEDNENQVNMSDLLESVSIAASSDLVATENKNKRPVNSAWVGNGTHNMKARKNISTV